MSLAQKVQDINDGLLDCYAAVENKGGTVPAHKNLDNLPDAIDSISGGGISEVESVTITNKNSLASLTMAADGTYSDYPLTVSVLPAEAPQMTQVLLSDPSVAKVIDNGDGTHSLRVISGGTTTVTVTDYSGTVSDFFTMTVTVALQSFTIDQGSFAEVEVGKTRQLSCSFVPRTASNKTIVWSSSDTSLATVDQTGLVTAIASGSFTISAFNAELNQTKTISMTSVVYEDNPDWDSIKNAVDNGEQPYAPGSELTIKGVKLYTSASAYTEYDYPVVVIGYRDTVIDGVTKHRMIVESKYLLPSNFRCNFENEAAVVATEETAQEGWYYYGGTGTSYGSYVVLNLQTGDVIPYELYGRVIKSQIDFKTAANLQSAMGNGLNYYKDSSLRQYLNSESTATGFGWTPQHGSDTNGNSSKYGGHLRGFPADFINALAPMGNPTARNNVNFSGEIETIYDRVFVLSKEEVYGTPATGTVGDEGTPYAYYVNGMGVSAATDSANNFRKKYYLNNQSQSNYRWLRSACRAYVSYEWLVNSDGALDNNNANSSGAVAPAYAIGK